MYMVAFVTLMVALVGLYAQVYTAQVSKGIAEQTGVASTMIQWHSTAASLAAYAVAKTSLNGACQLTPSAKRNIAGATNCLMPSGAVVSLSVTAIPTGATVCDAAKSVQPCYTPLPNWYLDNPYTFYSVAFSDGASTPHYYVLTYVPPTSDQYGLLCLPGDSAAPSTGACPGASKLVSVTFAAFREQIRNEMSMSPLSYGTVGQSGILTTPMVNLGGGTSQAFTYKIPAIVPVGSVGVITQVTPCTSC